MPTASLPPCLCSHPVPTGKTDNYSPKTKKAPQVSNQVPWDLPTRSKLHENASFLLLLKLIYCCLHAFYCSFKQFFTEGCAMFSNQRRRKEKPHGSRL
jgi:hypothetical protein